MPPRSPATRLAQAPASIGVNCDDTEATQLEFPSEGIGADAHWSTLLGLIRAAVDEIGLKQVAFDLDTSPSALSHALNERERHRVPARWLIYLLRTSRHDDLIAYLASLRGLELAPRKELSPEEKLERLKESLRRNLSPAMQEAIWKDAGR